MWLIAVSVLMNVIGLLSAAVALILICLDGGTWRGWLSSRRGQGSLSMLAGGCALAAGGQYKLVGLIYDTIRLPVVEPRLGPAVAAVLAVGAALLALGGWLLYLGRERESAGWAAPGGVTVARGFALMTSVVALIVALAGLSLFQYFTRSDSAVQPGREQPRQLTDRQVIDRFHELFYDSAETWRSSTWLGVPTQQNPNDVWIHQEIITELKPDFIIEAGTAAGGSAILWAMVLEQVNPQGKVITIDISDQIGFIKSGTSDPKAIAEWGKRIEEAQRLPVWREKIEFVRGSSTDPRVVAGLAARVKGRKVLVILDSDHSKNHVLNELRAYAPLVNIGSYLIVQDTNINGHPVLRGRGPGPMEAVEEFLATNKQFEPDRSRERLLFTMHPKGYLKRIA